MNMLLRAHLRGMIQAYNPVRVIIFELESVHFANHDDGHMD
ncbi:10620_t:CDS:1, partial [Acaulospora colombiana]